MNKFAKFLFVGVINSLFGYAMFSLLLFSGLHYSISAFFATILSILFNFKTTGGLVFKNCDNKLLPRFFLVYSVVYVVNVFCLKAFSLLNINLYAAGFVLILPLAMLSFFLMKGFVFGGVSVPKEKN